MKTIWTLFLLALPLLPCGVHVQAVLTETWIESEPHRGSMWVRSLN